MWVTDSLPFAATALRMNAGTIAWAVHFGVIYGFTGLACARRYAESGELWIALVPWVITVASVIAAGVTLRFVVPLLRSGGKASFVDWMSGWVAAFALLAIVLEAIAVLWVPVCG